LLVLAPYQGTTLSRAEQTKKKMRALAPANAPSGAKAQFLATRLRHGLSRALIRRSSRNGPLTAGMEGLRNCYGFAPGESRRPTSAKVGQMWGTVREENTDMGHQPTNGIGGAAMLSR